MTQVVTDAPMVDEASNKEHPYLSWPQTIVTLQISDAAAPIGLRHQKIALREHKILLITDVLPETPAADAGLCGGDVVEKIGSHDAAPFILGGGKMGAAAEGDGTLALTLRRPQVEVPVADAPAALEAEGTEVFEGTAGGPTQLLSDWLEEKVPEKPGGKELELDMAPTPLRRRNHRSEEESLAPRHAEEPLCGRCGVYGVSKRKALQQNSLCCNKCPNHGPWCTMHDMDASHVARSTIQRACRKGVASKIPDMEAMLPDQRACEENVGGRIPDMGVGHEDRTVQEDGRGEKEPADKDVTPVRGCRMIKIENAFEKRMRVDEEKRLKSEEKRLKADEATHLKVEEKRLKVAEATRLKAEEKDKADEARRLKAEEKRLKADQDMMRVEAAAALHKLERAHQKTCDLERKRQDTRKREEDKAFKAEMQKRLRTMGKTKSPLAENVAAEKAAAEENADGEKAAKEEVATEKTAAEVAAMAVLQAATAEANAEKTVLEEVEMVTAELAAEDKEATMVELSEVADNIEMPEATDGTAVMS